MPNGGSDCCGTCWFNERNKSEPGYGHADDQGPNRCVIRDLPIENPFYTYCANHPHHNPTRIDIPIGPVFTGDHTRQTSTSPMVGMKGPGSLRSRRRWLPYRRSRSPASQAQAGLC